MSADARPLAFISLIRDEVEARGLSALLESIARPVAAPTPLFLTPPVRGRDFFAAAHSRVDVDRWWRAHVPGSAVAVFMLSHEEGLAGCLQGLEGMVLVAASRPEAAAYAAWTVVEAGPEAAPLALAEKVILRFSRSAGPGTDASTEIFDARDARMVANVRAAPGPPPRSRPSLPALLDVGLEAGYTPTTPRVPVDPFDLLVAESARADRVGALTALAPQAARPRPRLRLPSGRGRGSAPSDDELAARLLANHPRLVVVGSRKGGVGKTSHAAGIAIVAGIALDSVGHSAAILDANIANPDAWGQLSLPAEAATVRDVVAALTTGREPPSPVHAATPALACFPERREGVEYSRGEVRRLAAYLRTRYAFAIVDMSNRLPDATSGPEAAVAAFWLDEADALVLPTATSRQDFNGVLDYLDVPGLPPTVVPCIVSASRRNRRHPVTRDYLREITARVDRVVEIPDEADNVRLAALTGTPVRDVSRRLGSAYRELTDALTRLPRRVRA